MVSLTEWQGHLIKNTNTNDKIQKIWKQLLKIKKKTKVTSSIDKIQNQIPFELWETAKKRK